MYGVPANLDLSRFVGATLIQLGVGEFQIQFHFHPDSSISVEGRWEVRDSTGVLGDKAKENAQRTGLYIHFLLGRKIGQYTVDAPRSFSLTFETGHKLTVFDDSREYESFSIQPGDIFV